MQFYRRPTCSFVNAISQLTTWLQHIVHYNMGNDISIVEVNKSLFQTTTCVIYYVFQIPGNSPSTHLNGTEIHA